MTALAVPNDVSAIREAAAAIVDVIRAIAKEEPNNDAPGEPTQAELDPPKKHAARIAEIHRELTAIYATDKAGLGLEAGNEFKLDKLMDELKRLRDEQYGIVREAVAYIPPKPRPRRKLPRSITRNLCKCDLERFKEELSPGVMLPDGRMVANTLPAKPPRMPRAKCIRELCAGCHLPKLFTHAARWGKSPAEYVKVWHGFEPSEADKLHLETLFAAWKERK